MTMRMVLVWSLGALLASAAEPSFDELFSEVQVGSAYQRQQAVSMMVRTGDPRVAGTLVGLLKDDDEAIRMGAARELATLAAPTTADALAAALSDESSHVRQYAAEGLLIIGSERHVPALVASVSKYLTGSPNFIYYPPDLEQALGAIGRLASAAPPEFVAMIENILAEGDYEAHRRWWFEAEIAYCLGQIGDRQALDALRQARAILESDHQDYRTWYALCKAMASIDPNGSPFDRPAADILESIVRGKGGTYGEQSLGELGEEAIDDLEWVLQFDRQVDRDRVLTALSVLSNLGGPRVAEILRRYVSDRLTPLPRASSSDIGYRCVSALGALLRVVPTETTAREVFVLAHRLDSDEQESLVSTISSSSSGVSNDVKQAFLEWAVFGNGQVGRLDRDARITVVRVWAKTGGDHSGSLLSEALRKLTSQVSWTSTADREAIEITEALRTIQDYDAVPTLIEAVQSPYVPKDAVAYALGDIGDPRAVPVLRELARRNDLGDQDCLWAAAALARLEIDYEENARVIRNALPCSLDQSRWLHDKETVTAVAALIADTDPAERYVRASKFPTFPRPRLLSEHAIAVLLEIGTEDVLEMLTAQIDLERITNLDHVFRVSLTASRVAERLNCMDQERWERITSIAIAVRALVSGVYLVSYEQRSPRAGDEERALAKQLEVIGLDPVLARKMWLAEINGFLDGTSTRSGLEDVSVGAVHLARRVYTPELVPLLERIVIESKKADGFPSEGSSVRYYKARSMAAQLLTEKTGRQYTFVDVDGQTHPGGWDPSWGR